MRITYPASVLLLMVLSIVGFGHDTAVRAASLTRPVQIEKTFDQGSLITHRLKVHQPPHTVLLYLNQRRAAEGSDTIMPGHLGFRYDIPEAAASMTQGEFDRVFEKLMTALRDNFGPRLDLKSLNSGGFLGVREMEKNSALAFRDFAPWAAYLENPTAFTQWQIHEIVLERWKVTGVFAPVIAALDRAGYDAELSGFEKLFVFSVDESKIRSELQALGIPGRQKFPYPGTIAFTINARR